MAKDDVQTNVRIPLALKEALQTAASEAGRSFTTEMVYRLAGSFDPAEGLVLRHRLEEVFLLKRDIDRERRHLEYLEHERLAGPELQQSREVIERLESLKERVLQDITELTFNLDKPGSQAGKLELKDLELWDRLEKKGK